MPVLFGRVVKKPWPGHARSRYEMINRQARLESGPWQDLNMQSQDYVPRAIRLQTSPPCRVMFLW